MGGYGAITEHKVPEGNTLQMSSGCFFAAPEDSSFTLRMPGGCRSCFFGGEGLVVAITGDTTVLLKTVILQFGRQFFAVKAPKRSKKVAARKIFYVEVRRWSNVST